MVSPSADLQLNVAHTIVHFEETNVSYMEPTAGVGCRLSGATLGQAAATFEGQSGGVEQ